jgi:hypothetical protein
LRWGAAAAWHGFFFTHGCGFLYFIDAAFFLSLLLIRMALPHKL